MKDSTKLVVHLTQGELKDVIESVINNTTSSEAKAEDLMTRQEVIDYFQISEPTLDRWARAGRIRKIKVGFKVYFKKDEILNITQ